MRYIFGVLVNRFIILGCHPSVMGSIPIYPAILLSSSNGLGHHPFKVRNTSSNLVESAKSNARKGLHEILFNQTTFSLFVDFMEDCWNGNRLVSKTKAEVDSLDRVQLSDLPLSSVTGSTPVGYWMGP